MYLFTILSYISLYLGLAFCALCLATGLYYLSELAEEYTMRTKIILKWITIGVAILHFALWAFDEFPFWPILVGFASHVCYSLLLMRFPVVSFTSPGFILSCLSFIVSHAVWYKHFTDFFTPAYEFHQLLGFFFLFVWLVPGGFFITLSISDMSLPGLDGMPSGAASMHSSSSGSRFNSDDVISGKKSRKSVFSWIMSCLRSTRHASDHQTLGKVL